MDDNGKQTPTRDIFPECMPSDQRQDAGTVGSDSDEWEGVDCDPADLFFYETKTYGDSPVDSGSKARSFSVNS